MKINKITLRSTAALLLFSVAAFVISCKKDADPISGDVSATVKNEATQDSQQDEVDDMSTNAIGSADPNGRVATNNDTRFTCAQVTATVYQDSIKGGTLTINFDKNSNGDANASGCTDPRGNVRKGLISITWVGGRWFKVGSVITVTLTNYSINGVVLNGTRVLSNVTTNILKPMWEIESDINVSWPDGKTAERKAHKTRQWDIFGATVTVSQTPGFDHAATGTTRQGVDYTMDIVLPLVYKLSCVGTSKVYIAVQGTKLIKFNDKSVTVDFGAGDCDNTFTVTFNGKIDTFSGDNSSAN